MKYVGATSGMDHVVEAVIFVNAIQGCEYISAHDLVVLGDNNWYRDAEGQETLRKKAKEMEFAGIVFYNTQIEDIPEQILTIGSKAGLPIMVAGDRTRKYTYSEISDYFSENYFIQTSDRFISKDQLLKKFYQCSDNDKIKCIMDKLWCFTGLDVYANYNGEAVKFGRKEHIQTVLETQEKWQRIEPSGLIKEEHIDYYYLESAGEEYYFLVSGFNSDSLDDYFLVISQGETLNNQDTRIFFYSLLALELDIKKRHASFAERHQEIIRMLQKGSEDETHILSVMERYNIKSSKSMMLITFDFSIDKMDVRKLFYDLLTLLKQNGIEEGMPIIGTLDDRLVVILPGMAEEKTLEQQIAALVENYASGNEKAIGGYARLEEWGSFNKVLTQANKALFWARKGQSRGILGFSELGVLKYISEEGYSQFSATEDGSISGRVIAFDKENDTQLYDTLRAFIINVGSTSKASKELFVSINAVKYRMVQIEKLLQTDFSKVENRTLIEVEIQMRDMMNR
jgi:hypothetical protein